MKSKIFLILTALGITAVKAASNSDDTKCWFDESKSDSKCCSSTKLEAEYADEDGHLWTHENGELCSIKEPKCFASLTGDYECCEDAKDITYIDADGEWGNKGSTWCGKTFKRRWNDRSVRGESLKEWKRFKTVFKNEIYPATNNSRIINNDIKFDYRTQLSMNMGADESEIRFAWYSFNSYVPKIRILDITDQLPNNVKDVYKYSESLNINDFDMSKAKIFTGIAINNKVMGEERIFSNRVTVTDLENNHYYLYQYNLDNEWIIENPPRLYRSLVNEDDMTILVVGDPQIGGNRKRIAYHPELGGWVNQSGIDAVMNDSYNWRDFLNKALTYNPDVSFIISCGDQVHSDDDEQQEMEYAGLLSAPQLGTFPLAPVSGNHDQTSETANFKHHFHNPNEMSDEIGAVNSGPDYFFARGKALFIYINGNNLVIMDHKNAIERAILSYPNSIWRIVVLHFDLYGPASHINEDTTKVLRTGLTPIFFENMIDVVLQGHNHIHARTHLLTRTRNCPDSTDESINKKNADNLPKAQDYKCYNATKPVVENYFQNKKDVASDIVETDGLGVVESEYRTKFYNPNGVIYFEASTVTGSIYHTPELKKYSFVARRGQPLDPLYSIMKITVDKSTKQSSLIFDTFKVSDGSKYDNGYAITKDYVETNYKGFPKQEEPKMCWANTLNMPCCSTARTVRASDENGDWGAEGGDWCGFIKSNNSTSTAKTIVKSTTSYSISIAKSTTNSVTKSTTTTKSIMYKPTIDSNVTVTSKTITPKTSVVPTTTSTAKVKPTDSPSSCWSESLGYDCCGPNTPVRIVDDDGQWGKVDGQWCGIIESTLSECWALVKGYRCCENPEAAVEFTDADGDWSYENEKWCGILKSTSKTKTTTRSNKPTTTTTTTKNTTITTRTTTTTEPSPTRCAALYGQCGGIGYDGPTCCESGSYCLFSGDYYSQCVPKKDPNQYNRR